MKMKMKMIQRLYQIVKYHRAFLHYDIFISHFFVFGQSTLFDTHDQFTTGDGNPNVSIGC